MAVVRRYNDLEHARLMMGTKIGMTGVLLAKNIPFCYFHTTALGTDTFGRGWNSRRPCSCEALYLDAHDNYVRCLGAVTILFSFIATCPLL